jgi:inner membrane protein
MDLLSHAVLSASGAVAIARPHEVRIAAITGAAAGLLPDSDTLIDSAADPLLNLEFHRHFSHSLAIVPLGALIIAAIAWLVLRGRIGFPRLYGYALIGYLLSPLLDACTSYGTHLLWPFSTQPIALSIIAIIDPVFTLMLIALLAAALVRQRIGFAHAAVVGAAAYLLVGFLQHERAERAALALVHGRAHTPDQVLVKPTLGNLLLWRSVYVHEGRVHVDAIRAGIAGLRTYGGENTPLLDPVRDLALPRDSVQRRDVDRFIAFTRGYPVRHPLRPDVIGDARYAMLPTSLEPIWGIVLDEASPERRVRFETTRRLTAEMRGRFIDMLLGRDV